MDKKKVAKSTSQKKETKKTEIKSKAVKKETPKKEVTKKETYRVTYLKDERMWSVKLDSSERASKKFRTKEEALDWAEEASESKGRNLIVHKKDGKFQKK